MPAPEAPSRPVGVPGRTLSVLATLATVLIAAFVAAPGVLAGGGFSGERGLVEALRESFTGYWSSGDRAPSPALEEVIDYWFRYHLAKAAIAALLLTVLITLSVILWKTFLNTDDPDGSGPRHADSPRPDSPRTEHADGSRADSPRTGHANSPARGKRRALVPAGLLVTALALVSLLAVMANIQGAAAPYSSLLPMLTDGADGTRLTGVLDQVRTQLAAAPDTNGHALPALDAMIDDFARYHAVLAVIAAIVAAALIAISTFLWRKFARTNPSGKRTRRVLGSFGALSALLALAMIVIAAANTTTAASPVPALLAFFEGGW